MDASYAYGLKHQPIVVAKVFNDLYPQLIQSSDGKAFIVRIEKWHKLIKSKISFTSDMIELILKDKKSIPPELYSVLLNSQLEDWFLNYSRMIRDGQWHHVMVQYLKNSKGSQSKRFKFWDHWIL